ncbi:NAD(P)H-dependent oxidoreductase [Saccharibacillus alkalitolerans]|uniref:NAD(P)H-dependent oxidoreductase n=1 Tax=Saccharibacillus alkalitolerans TaxID=2705290 RepID=A0ABX0FE17_9BACL|nr:NAD(P)H-dependent oxidoreductase [Saccharibacillus alkalitolerans]NGZ76812.1 NAD(P)H-dependent oxidoreductase [Saccharibacillus alkalitolerans]
MKIAMINGSPKGGATNSGFLLDKLRPLLPREAEISTYRVGPKALKEEDYDELYRTDILVLSFPLYFDAVPSHLLRMMTEMEQRRPVDESQRTIRVYAMVNNGFFEGDQCKLAVNIVENWCERCGFHFGTAFGHGAGEMFSSLGNVPVGSGPLKNLGFALEHLVHSIRSGEHAEPFFTQPKFPRFLWQLSSTRLFWHGAAKKNGLKPKDLRRRPGIPPIRLSPPENDVKR